MDSLKLRTKSECKYDILSLGEIMLRLDPGQGRIHTTRQFKVWEGGLVWYGGLIFCLFWLAWYLPRHPKLRGWALADLLALGACLGIFIGRWASFLSGENYGKEAPDLPWAVVFPPHPDTQAVVGVDLHPAQLYHSLHGLVLWGLHAGRMRRMFVGLWRRVRTLVSVSAGRLRY